MTDKEFIKAERKETWYPKIDTIDKEEFPACFTFPTGMMYGILPNPKKRLSPEFVHIDYPSEMTTEESSKIRLLIMQWNMCWEAGHLRGDMFIGKEDFPESLNWLEQYQDVNINLLPKYSGNSYYVTQQLLNLLPFNIRQKHGLPLSRKGYWPSEQYHWYLDQVLPRNYDERLSKAFAEHIWPLLNSGSSLNKFSKNDPILLLSHNLNYWAPQLHCLIENKFLETETEEFEKEKHRKIADRYNKNKENDFIMQPPRHGSYAWWGEQEAQEMTEKLVAYANTNGELSNIIDAVRSNRIEDDFSNFWSYAKEDFERKIYRKRNKYTVKFVEINDALPVISTSSELHDNLLWEDFFSLLDTKEKTIVICLKNSQTKLAELAQKLGYSGHSPVSKALKKIHLKLDHYIKNS